MKRPSFQFYPGDWLQDAALRTVSVGARGLWIEMLCYMHQGSTYGYLKVNHNVILTPNLTRMVGATLQEVEGWLSELKDAGVYAVDGDGAIFSRRMIRDEEVRKARADGGKLGGNPKLMEENKVNLTPNLQPTPSSSSSSLTSSLTATSKSKSKSKPTVANAPRGERETCFDQFWEAYPAKVGKGDAIKAWKKITSLIPETLELILQALSWQRDCPAWLKDDGQFIPNPATYLNGKRWLDEPRKQSPPGTTEVGRHNAAAVESWLNSQPMGNVYEND